jgi:type IV pilus assembly protein PilA
MSLIERCRERRRHGEEDEGFTLIELLVVLLIIGILLAIAIPTFLSITKGANGTVAQSNLNTALTGADSYYTTGAQTYNGLTTSTQYSNINQIDTGLSFISGNSTQAHEISYVVGGSGQVITLADYAPGQNDCWGIVDIKATQSSGTNSAGQTAVGTYYAVVKNVSSSTGCNAASIDALTSGVKTSGFPPA